MSIFQDEKSWNGISNIETRRKNNVKEFRDANGLSWNSMKESMHLESEGKYKRNRVKEDMKVYFLGENGELLNKKWIIDDSLSESGSPVTTRLDVKDMEIFGAMPMDEDIVVVKCNNCQRPLLPSKFKEHSGKTKKNCGSIKLSKKEILIEIW